VSEVAALGQEVLLWLDEVVVGANLSALGHKFTYKAYIFYFFGTWLQG
jgi:hypothetical protein